MTVAGEEDVVANVVVVEVLERPIPVGNVSLGDRR